MAHHSSKRVVTSEQSGQQHGQQHGQSHDDANSGGMLDKAKEMGTAVLDKAKDAVGSVGSMASQAAGNVGHRAEDMLSSAAHGISAAGERLDKQGPQGGMAGYASHAVASTLQGGGHYLEEANFSGMARDMGNVVKNHPVPALLLCLGLGFCLGRMMNMKD